MCGKTIGHVFAFSRHKNKRGRLRKERERRGRKISERLAGEKEKRGGKQSGGVMDFRMKFTENLNKAMKIATDVSAKSGVSYVGSEHLIYAFLSMPDCVAYRILTEKIRFADYSDLFLRHLDKNISAQGFTPRFPLGRKSGYGAFSACRSGKRKLFRRENFAVSRRRRRGNETQGNGNAPRAGCDTGGGKFFRGHARILFRRKRCRNELSEFRENR